MSKNAAATEKKKTELGDTFYPIIRRFLLQSVDYLWVEHLEAMEYLRSSVNLRAYGQRDPLVEYKKEGLKLFQSLEETYVNQVTHNLPNLMSGNPASVQQRPQQAVSAAARMITHSTGSGQAAKKEYERNDHVKITNGTETREMKFKKAEPLLQSGEWRIVE